MLEDCFENPLEMGVLKRQLRLLPGLSSPRRDGRSKTGPGPPLPNFIARTLAERATTSVNRR